MRVILHSDFCIQSSLGRICVSASSPTGPVRANAPCQAGDDSACFFIKRKLRQPGWNAQLERTVQKVKPRYHVSLYRDIRRVAARQAAPALPVACKPLAKVPFAPEHGSCYLS